MDNRERTKGDTTREALTLARYYVMAATNTESYLRRRQAQATLAKIDAALATTEQAPAALTVPEGWKFKRNSDGSVGIFAPPPLPGESQRTSHAVYASQSRDLHELLGKLADHQAAAPSVPPQSSSAQGLTEDRRDAERYRWLRNNTAVARRDFALRDVGIDASFHLPAPLMFCEGENALKQLDAAIDRAALSTQQEDTQ